jgi:preprotein translocase subunit SecE
MNVKENKVTKFLKEAKIELKKVVWPTRKQAINLTIVVIVATLLVALFIGGADFLFSRLVEILIKH